MVWSSLGLVVALFGGLFGFSLYRYIQIKDSPASQGNIFQVCIQILKFNRYEFEFEPHFDKSDL